MRYTLRSLVIVLVALTVQQAAFARQAPTYVWIEAEQYDRSTYDGFEVSGMGREALLSGGRWIMKGLSPAEAQGLGEDGIALTYKAQVAEPGRYDLWARVGWFSARADLRWRVNGGPWHDFAATEPTRNLMELGFFTEASWGRLGAVELPGGEATIELHYPTPPEGERMLVALDCLALVAGPWTPEGGLKPDETYDSPRDREAAERVYDLPATDGVARGEVELTGLWQVARYDDPDMDADTYEPVRALPTPEDYRLRWMAFDAPGSPWNVDPLVFGHRLIYRTRFRTPQRDDDAPARSYKLHFSGTNWIVSVFVDGELAGTHEGVWVPWDLDITEYVKPGETQELALVVKGTYYALDADAMGGGNLMDMRNRPRANARHTRWVAPIYPSTKGDGDGYVYGICNPVTLVSMGEAYTEDVFIRPSVQDGKLDVDVTVRNPTDRDRRLLVRCEAIEDDTGEVARGFGPVRVEVPAGESAEGTVSGAWEDAKLWWPVPNPNLYRLRTTVLEEEPTRPAAIAPVRSTRIVDVHEELFGFREVTVEGTGIYINGVRRNVWNWVDVARSVISEPIQWAEAWREERQRFMRFSHGRRIRQVLPTREQRLEFYDRNGIAGRLCTMIDGMFITQKLGERTRDEDGNPVLIPNRKLWESYRLHMAQVARAYRNHPSVILYQAENELVYITGMNVYGAYLDRVEELMNEVVEAGRRYDWTRPYTVGGGGDLSGRLEINSPHYPNTILDRYPRNAYEIEHYSTKISRWPWKRDKPWVVGESFFANHHDLGAYVAGDEVFRSFRHARQAKAKFLRMIYGGYRWAGVAGFFPWDNLSDFEDSRKIFSSLYVCPRRQTSRIEGGRENRLLFKVLNDTLSDRPILFEWSYRAGGRVIASDEVVLNIEPGFGEEREILIDAPETDERIDGVLTLRLTQEPGGPEAGRGTGDPTAIEGGGEPQPLRHKAVGPPSNEYVDERSVPVLPALDALEVGADVFVLDRQGALAGALEDAGTPFERIEDLSAVRDRRGLLLIGHDTLRSEEAFRTELLAFAAAGGRVICLEQENPPAGAALPAPIKPTRRFGGYAHPQALGTEVFRDLGAEDLIDWAAGHPTYKNVYRKPSRGGRSLAQAGSKLEFSPLIEVPCGEGVIVLCQLRVGANLARDPAAAILLRNLVETYAGYQPATGVVAVYDAPAADESEDLLISKVEASGALVDVVGDLDAVLDPARYQVAVVHASPANLQALLERSESVQAFQAAGSWLVLHGLTPEGIEAFNTLVDEQDPREGHPDHMIRPFRIERVVLANPHHRLAAGLGHRDVALVSPRHLQHSLYWISGETFSSVIDGRDFAPFTLPPGAPDDPFVYEPTGNDRDPYNFVNGMLGSDHWRYIRQIPVGDDGVAPLTFRLRRPDVLHTVKIWNNDNYWTIKDLDVVIDGDEDRAIRMTLPDSDAVTTAELPEPVRVGETITLRVRSWREKRRPSGESPSLVGIDNVRFLRPPSEDGPVFLDSVGGLVAFEHPESEGGVFLSQIQFLADEPRPDNADQKLRVLGVLLQNMGAGFRSAAAVAVPGVNVRFQTVNIQEHCNAYLDERGTAEGGWFLGDPRRNLSLLPRGRGEFADVTYHVVDYGTAPIPDCIILGGERPRFNPAAVRDLSGTVEGIRVGGKADVLYFLHAAHVSEPVTDRERERMTDRRRPFELPVVMKYVLHYADGQTAEVPVVLEKQVDHWLTDAPDPAPLEGAQVGWSRPVEAAEDEGPRRAVIYSMQVPNPRPGQTIETIDAVRVSQRAVPAVLSITLGEVVGKPASP